MRAVRRAAPAAREHEFEPQRGLPELLPADEHLLWQGSPQWRSLALRAFHLRALAGYFAVLLALRASFAVADGAGAVDALRSLVVPAALALIALGMVASLAWLTARTAVYTVTDRRVVMRIGIVLTLTYNLPFTKVTGAGLRLHGDGSGDIPLELAGDVRIALLNLWPHARPWRITHPQPMLRGVADAAEVARTLSAAWSRVTGIAAATPQVEPTDVRGTPGARPALAGH